jgi:hypothetical protein
MMTPKERVIAALRHIEPDRVPTGENGVDGRREKVVHDYCTAHVDLARKLEWDYVRVPCVPAVAKYQRPQMTGPYSWIDSEGNEVHSNPDAGNVIVRKQFPNLTVDDLHDMLLDFYHGKKDAYEMRI